MQIRTPSELGLLVRDRRRTQDLTQQALAERVGVTRQWIIDLEKGKRGAPIGLVMRTLNALGFRIQIETGEADSARPSERPEQGTFDMAELIAQLDEDRS